MSSPYSERERPVPMMIVVAGPSGSGKSSNFPIQSMSVPYFSVDDWCAQREGSYQGISPETRRRGGELCEAFVREQIEKRESFAVETTLRGVHAIDQAESAQRVGFLTVMLYISVDSLELAVERVRLRGLAGGHSAPPSVIEMIYERSHQNLKRAVEVFSVVQVFTSLQATGAEDEELIHLEAIFNQGSLSFGDRTSWPDWLDHIEL